MEKRGDYIRLLEECTSFPQYRFDFKIDFPVLPGEFLKFNLVGVVDGLHFVEMAFVTVECGYPVVGSLITYAAHFWSKICDVAIELLATEFFAHVVVCI